MQSKSQNNNSVNEDRLVLPVVNLMMNIISISLMHTNSAVALQIVSLVHNKMEKKIRLDCMEKKASLKLFPWKKPLNIFQKDTEIDDFLIAK